MTRRLAGLFAGLLTLVWAQGALAAIGTPSRLGNFALSSSSSTTVAITLGTCQEGAACTGATSASGNLIVCIITTEVGSLADVVSSATDTAGNTYAVTTKAQAGGGDINTMMIYKVNAAALSAGNTITATFSAAQSFRTMSCTSTSGVATASANDFFGTSAGTGTAPSIATGTLAQAAEIIFAGCGVFTGGSDAYTQSAGFTAIDDQVAAASGAHSARDIVASTTGPTFGPTLGTSREFACLAQSFKGAGAASTSKSSSMPLLGVDDGVYHPRFPLLIRTGWRGGGLGGPYVAPVVANCQFTSSLSDGCAGAQANGLIVNANLATTKTALFLNVVGGSGYTNGMGYAWTGTSGGCSVEPSGTIDVSGGVLTNPVISVAGSGCTSRPTVSIPAGAGAGSGGSLVPSVYQLTPHTAATTFSLPGVDFGVSYDQTLSLTEASVATLPGCATKSGGVGSTTATVNSGPCTINGLNFIAGDRLVIAGGISGLVTVSNTKCQTAAAGADCIHVNSGACNVALVNDELTDGATVGGSDSASVAVVSSQCTSGTISTTYTYCHNVWYKCLNAGGVPGSVLTVNWTEKFNVFRNISLATNVNGHGEAEYFFSGTANQQLAVDCEFNTYLDEYNVAQQTSANNSQTSNDACAEADGVVLVSPIIKHNYILGPGPWAATGSDNSAHSLITGSANLFGGHQDTGGAVTGTPDATDNYFDYTGKWFPYNPTGGTFPTDYPALAGINAVTGTTTCNTTSCN